MRIFAGFSGNEAVGVLMIRNRNLLISDCRIKMIRASRGFLVIARLFCFACITW